jgi:hypothetical protein
MADSDSCEIAPVGWYCTRGAGHSGPCAARPQIVAVAPGTPEYDALLKEARDTVCEFDGHEWAEAGDGLLICLRCEDEKWAGHGHDTAPAAEYDAARDDR